MKRKIYDRTDRATVEEIFEERGPYGTGLEGIPSAIHCASVVAGNLSAETGRLVNMAVKVLFLL